MFGPGSEFFGSLTPPPGSGGTLTGARDGLSVSTTDAVLGQSNASPGGPAAITENRYIPTDQFYVVFGSDNGTDPGLIIWPFGSTIIFNGGTGNSGRYHVQGDDGSGGFTVWEVIAGFGSIQQTADGAPYEIIDPASGSVLFVGMSVGVQGFNAALRKTTGLIETFQQSDYLLVLDTAAGNATVDLDPTVNGAQLGSLKKLGTDVNTVTLNAASGNIYGPAGPVASYTFFGPGQTVSFQTDGVDIYLTTF